ncbi:hypothetical protein P3342_012889 [Pyrenophora teres f. teres]|nr:hypothetical protein P3342_012889 [Pyrenophora teres f. teres]
MFGKRSFTSSKDKDRSGKITKQPKRSHRDASKQKVMAEKLDARKDSPIMAGESPVLTSAIVTVIVGSDQRLFAAHEDVLCHSRTLLSCCGDSSSNPAIAASICQLRSLKSSVASSSISTRATTTRVLFTTSAARPGCSKVQSPHPTQTNPATVQPPSSQPFSTPVWETLSSGTRPCTVQLIVTASKSSISSLCASRPAERDRGWYYLA